MSRELTPEERRRLRTDFEFYALNNLSIRTKSGAIEPFRLNVAQRYIHGRLESQLADKGWIRAIILKGRQQGCTTYIGGRFYHKTTHRFGCRTFILTHEQDATDNVFEMTSRYHEYSREDMRPATSAANAKELHFGGLASGYKVGTAGSRGVGRSSTIQMFHGCLSPETWVVDGLTGNLRKMREFAVGDMVRTHAGSVAAVSFISRQRKMARQVVLKGMGQTPLVATDEHRFWTKDGWRQLADIKEGDCIGFPVADIVDGGVCWPFRLPDSVRPQGGGSREVGPDDIVPTYNLGRVLGLYLAEGCIVKQVSGVPSGVTFAIHERETARTVEWLKPLAHLFRSVKVATRNGSKTVTVTAYGRSFASFVRAHCGEKDSKALPVEWSKCGTGFVRGLVHGYLSGDGHSSKRPGDRRISAPSIRSAITVGMRDALASLGYGFACIGWRDAAVRSGRNERAQWSLRLTGSGVDGLVAELGWTMPPRKRSGAYGEVRVCGGYAWIPVRSISDAAESEVMDFEVDHSDHSYCVLQGATHNSEVAFWPNAEKHWAGVMQAVPMEPETEIILESTANGVGGLYYDTWKDAEQGIGDYIPIFVPWFWQPEYRRSDVGKFAPDADEKLLAKVYGLDKQQLAWRRFKIHELKSTDKFKQEYPCNAEEAFLFSGRLVFEQSHIMAAQAEVFSPIHRAQVSTQGAITKHKEGELHVWEDPRPGESYVIGADVAEGLESGDYSSADILAIPDGRQIAQWHGHIDPDRYGEVLFHLGKHYNKAFIGVERNNHGLTTLTTLKRKGYPRLYVQEDVERRSDGTQTKKIGWLTTRKSKVKIIDQLAAELRDGNHGICSIDTVKELGTYVINTDGSYGAKPGCYDDRVMSRAIAGEMLYAAPRGRKR